jgi:hypothetical protein
LSVIAVTCLVGAASSLTALKAERCREIGAVTLKGGWHTNRQYLALKKGSGQIVLPFTGGKVNVVRSRDHPATPLCRAGR